MKNLFVIVLLAASAFAQQKVFIQNDSGYASVYDNAQPEIAKHFTIVGARSDADLVFAFTINRVRAGTVTNGSVDQNGDIHARTSSGERSILELNVIDQQTGQKAYTNSRNISGPLYEGFVPWVALFHKDKPPSNKLVQDYLRAKR